METRDERLATWLDDSIITKAATCRLLRGSISPDSTNNQDEAINLSETIIPLSGLEDALLKHKGKSGAIDEDASSKPWTFIALSVPRLQPGRLALSIPRKIFNNIQSTWHLHPRTVEVFLTNNGVFTTFRCPNTGRLSFLLKVANSRSTGSDCLSMTYDQSERAIYVLYHHLYNEQAIFATLHATPQQCVDPHFFITALYRSHQQQIEAHRNSIDMAILSIERQTGYGKPNRIMDPGRRPNIDTELVLENPQSIIQQLSFCQTDLAIIRHVTKCCLDCGEWLIQNIDRGGYQADDEAREGPMSQKTARSLVRDEVEYTWRLSAMILSQVQQMSERAQSQTTFILNSITQKDSEYTAAISIDGKRDSIAMRTISILGIIYLPPTFVATFFSMEMFSWGAGGDGKESSSPTASPFLWVYWVVALPLTLVTVIIWLLWARRENTKSMSRLAGYRSARLTPKSDSKLSIAPAEKIVEKMV